MESNQQKHKLINPLTRYEDLKLEFPPNTYPKQVLQTSFKHPPDCGEKSYVASGRLKGRHALVTGGDSGIGRAVVSKHFEDTLLSSHEITICRTDAINLTPPMSLGYET